MLILTLILIKNNKNITMNNIKILIIIWYITHGSRFIYFLSYPFYFIYIYIISKFQVLIKSCFNLSYIIYIHF